MSHNKVEVFVLRHAAPTDGTLEAGLDPEKLSAIEIAAEKIASRLAEPASATIFSSPKRRTRETAQRLLESDALTGIAHQEAPIISPFLDDREYFAHRKDDRAILWIPELGRMISEATQRPGFFENTGIVLVTHEPVITDMTLLRRGNQRPNDDYVGVNHFEWSI